MFAAVERLRVAFEHQAALRFLRVVASQTVFPEEGRNVPCVVGRGRSLEGLYR
jgi:hypothetical protein